jgi:hypothetical protein
LESALYGTSRNGGRAEMRMPCVLYF